MLKLILPDTRYLDSYIEALREGYNFSNYESLPEEEIKKIENDPHTFFESENLQGGGFTAPDGKEYERVPHNKYWLIEDDVFIGGVWVRYALNPFTEKYAGHVGAGIRPSKRRQGYATKILGMALSKLKARGVTKAMVTASDDNPGSWKCIEANGGVLTGKTDDIFDGGKDNLRQYWIDLTGECG